MENYKNRKVDKNKPVELYRCLNRKGFIFSIRQEGKVVAHTDKVLLKDCELIVNKSGKQRSVQTKVRNVHAYVRGFLGDYNDVLNSFSFLLNYNPYVKEGFTIQNTEINKCSRVYIQENKIYCQL